MCRLKNPPFTPNLRPTVLIKEFKVLTGEMKLALACLVHDTPEITVGEAHWEMRSIGWKEPGLVNVEIFLNCHPPKMLLKHALMLV